MPLGLLVVVGMSASAIDQAASPTVHLTQGTLLGTADQAGVERFAGIPYAKPPVGGLRFARAVQDDEPWPSGMLDATRAGAPCLQNPAGDPRISGDTSVPPPSEDCLHLTLWRPPVAGAHPPPRGEHAISGLPVMVYVFGGGLCTGFNNNPLIDGANLASRGGVIVVTVSYRLGALGFLPNIPGAFGNSSVDSEEIGSRSDPHHSKALGNGGMNGIYDIIVALRWLQSNLADFGGDAKRVMLLGQSSGSYAVCTLCVSHAAQGLFWAAGLLSGPCLGGPPDRGWGPVTSISPSEIAKEVMTTLNVSDVHGLRAVRNASLIQWPDRLMDGTTLAPYFSAYFTDSAVVSARPELLWRAAATADRPRIEQASQTHAATNASVSVGSEELQSSAILVPLALMVGATSKDGTAAFYGTAPTLGNVPPNPRQIGQAAYTQKLHDVWGELAAQVEAQYPLTRFGGSAQAAFIQADADAYVICPQLEIARLASAAGAKVWHYEFRHFLASRIHPQGFGCDCGVELDVVALPPAAISRQQTVRATDNEWATHGADVRFVFGTNSGADDIQATNGHNRSFCPFTSGERSLSNEMLAFWTTLASTANPNPDEFGEHRTHSHGVALAGVNRLQAGHPSRKGGLLAPRLLEQPSASSHEKGLRWPEYMEGGNRTSRIFRLVEGKPNSMLAMGIHEADCAFWRQMWSLHDMSNPH